MSHNEFPVKNSIMCCLGLFLVSVLSLGFITIVIAQIDDGSFSVSIKQKNKITLVTVNNNSEKSVFSVKLHIMNGEIKFVKVKEWDRKRIDQNTVVVSSDDRPTLPSSSLIIILITSVSYSGFQLSAYDDKNAQIDSIKVDAKTTEFETQISIELNKYSYYTGETMVVSGVIPPKSLFHAQTVDPGDPYGEKRGHKGLGGTASTSGFADENGRFREFLLLGQTAYPGTYGVKVRVFDSERRNAIFEKTLPFEVKEWPKPIAVITNLEEYDAEGDFFYRNVDIIVKGQPYTTVKIIITDPLGNSVFVSEGQADNDGLFLQSYLIDKEKNAAKGTYTITASQQGNTVKWTFKVV